MTVSIAAFGDAVVPLFCPADNQTWFGTASTILAITLLEGALLRWRVKSVPFLWTFCRTLLVNLASGASGFMVLALLDSMLIGFVLLILFLFLFTLAVEIPLIHWLYRAQKIPWKRVCLLGVGINIVSYAMILSLPAGPMFWQSWIGPGLDAQHLVKWKNPDLLKRVRGTIYSCRPELSYFDFRREMWTPVPGAPSMTSWDICGETCVYHCYEDPAGEHLIISKLPDFRVVHKLHPKEFIQEEYDMWRAIRRIAISPDEKKVALLFDLGTLSVPDDDDGFYDLGPKCRIIVLDTDTGQEIACISRWALDYEFCWMQDARRILYYTLDDTALLDVGSAPTPEKGRRHSTGLGAESVFKAGLHSFDILSGETSRFSDGYAPSLASETGQILSRNGHYLILLGPNGNALKRVRVANLGHLQSIISPDGGYILARIMPHDPHRLHDFMTLIDLDVPGERHIIEEDGPYKGSESYRSTYTWVPGR